jgi:hypothetical protein
MGTCQIAHEVKYERIEDAGCTVAAEAVLILRDNSFRAADRSIVDGMRPLIVGC